MSAHTPGPWCWEDPADDSLSLEPNEELALRTVASYGEDKTEVIDGKSYTSFALRLTVLYGQFENAADARLIAAAPELMEALQRIATDFRGITNPTNALREIARAAIARATGAA